MSSTSSSTSGSTRGLVQELTSLVCRCGAHKTPNTTFCVKCYVKLPPLNRRALYKRIGEGYEQSYAEAAEFLRLAGRFA